MQRLSPWWLGVAAFCLTACGGDETGSSPTLVRVDDADIADCPAGGLAVKVGRDANGNGVLDEAEVESTNLVCNGAPADEGGSSQGCGTANSDCSGGSFVGVVFEGSLVGVNFSNADLRYAVFEEVAAAGANFSGANLTGAIFYSSNLAGADFRGATAVGARFEATSVTAARFDGANLDGSVWAVSGQSYAYNTRFDGASLRGATLRLSTSEGRPVSFAGADLSGSWLANTSLGYANMQGANLSGAVLSALWSADLEGANLSGATLLGANLNDASVDGATNFDGIFYDDGTVLPAGASPGAGAINVAEANLSGVDFSGFWLLGSFHDKNLSSANFAGVRRGPAFASFYNSNLAGANFAGVDFAFAAPDGSTAYIQVNTSLATNANFAGAHLDYTLFYNVNATNSTFVGADLSNVNAASTLFTNANLTAASLARGFFSSASFAGANLTRATFGGAYTNSADFTGTIFNDTYYNLTGNFTPAGTAGTVNAANIAELPSDFGVGLTYGYLEAQFLINLDGFDFSGARLPHASFVEMAGNINFASANLYNGNFANSNLDGSNFAGANLYDATIYNASLRGANLVGADLRNADMGRGWAACCQSTVPPNFEGAIFGNTLCPNGVPSDLRPSGTCDGAYAYQAPPS